MPPEPQRTPPRALAIACGGVLLFALWAMTRSWDASLLDRYEFRQLQTALSTWWLAHEGWQLAYLTPLFGPPWSVPMEFPFYQILVATLHQATGLPLEQSGRFVSIALLLACLPALHDLLRLTELPASRRWIVLACVLSAPVYLFYARTFMIETTALCFAVWFLALLRRALAQPCWPWIALTTLAATLAGLAKITTFLVFGLPALALVAAAWLKPAAARSRILLASLLPALVALGISWWWIQHGDAVKDSNPFTGFLAARELRAWNFGALGLRFDWSFWLRLQETVVSHNLSEGALAIALLCAPFASARCRWTAGAAALGFVSGPLVFANLYHIHDYYYAANALLLLGAAGLMVASAWDNPRLPRGANWLALGIFLACQANAFYRGYYSHHRNPAPPPPALAATIRETVPADGVVLIYGADWNPLLPYYAQRRALMVPGEREHETAVLETILDRLPPRQISAMVVHGDRLRPQSGFIAERAAHFGLSPTAAARGEHEDLYLPAGTAGPLLPGPEPSPFPADLSDEQMEEAARDLFTPAPHSVRSRYGISLAAREDRPIINAHAPAEFHFRPGSGARTMHIVAGLAEAAYSPESTARTDGITVEIVAVTATHAVQLHERQLDPANRPADRGPQTFTVNIPPGFTGELVLRIGPGPAMNPTNDWAYIAEVRVR